MVIILGFISLGYSQSPLLLDSNNVEMHRKFEYFNQAGYVWWKCDSISSGELFTKYKHVTGLGNYDSMVLINTWEDSITYLVHKKYQQYYKGLKVEGAIYNENSLNGNVINSNGFIAENLNKNSTPSVSDSLALNYALSYLNASKYAWEDDSLEYYLNLDSMSTDSTLFPRGELIWAIKGSRNIIDTNYVLCWKFKIWTLNPKDIIQYIYVCANTGQIISTRNISVNGTFNHIYYGTQSIDTRWFGGLRNKFYLKANDDGHNIFTKDENFHKSWTDTD